MAILLGSNCKEMMMMMIQFSMLMLMMSSAALVYFHKMSYFFCRYFHFCSSSCASLQISGIIIRESRDIIRDLQNFRYFWHFWSGVNTECNNISGNHILCMHTVINPQSFVTIPSSAASQIFELG
jgi:hypothetical protein